MVVALPCTIVLCIARTGRRASRYANSSTSD